MGVLSGKDGKVLVGDTEVAEITQWRLTTRSSNSAYASSSTSGFKRRVAGVKDAAGQMLFKLDLLDPVTGNLEEGSMVTLKLYLNQSYYYQVPAVVDALHFEVDIHSGDIVGGSAEFSSTGPWIKPAYPPAVEP